jgi:hypothetical protein
MHSNRSDYYRPKSSGGGYSSRGHNQGRHGSHGGGYRGRNQNSRDDNGNYYRQQNERNYQQNDEKAANYGRGGSLPTGRNGPSNYKPKHQGLHQSTLMLTSSLPGNQMERPNQVVIPEAVSFYSLILSPFYDRSQWSPNW